MPYPGTFTAPLSEDKTNFIVTDGLEEYLKDRKNGLSDKTMRIRNLVFILIVTAIASQGSVRLKFSIKSPPITAEASRPAIFTKFKAFIVDHKMFP